MTSSNTEQLSAAGVSIWLDDLSRELLTSQGLQKLVADRNVVGVTTNPTIFATALSKGDAYDDQVAELAAAGKGVTDAVFAITTADVSDACTIFQPIYESTAGFDGRVSIEVEPGLAHDTNGTIEQAQSLHQRVGKENVLIKIPATLEGLDAITQTIASGISVNVTLIFSLDRYRAVIDAYLTGLEQARDAGLDLSKIHSVASFFVSRVDTEIDNRLDTLGTDEAAALKGKAGVANAQLAYQVFQEQFSTDRATELLAAGANKQRPLWASTGVKNPDLADTTYVVEMVAPEVVNTMPGKTLEATFDHATITGNTIEGTYPAAEGVMTALKDQGVNLDDVFAVLEREGIEKFAVSWGELTDTVTAELDKHNPHN